MGPLSSPTWLESGQKDQRRIRKERTEATTATLSADFAEGSHPPQDPISHTQPPAHMGSTTEPPTLCPPPPYSLLWMALSQPARPPPRPAHRAISLPSFQYFLLVVLLRRKSRGDSTPLLPHLVIPALCLARPWSLKASFRASVSAASDGS